MTNAIFEKQTLHLNTLVNLRNRTRVTIISPQLKKLSAKLYIPLYCIVFLLHPIDKQTRTHARTHGHTNAQKSILSKRIFTFLGTDLFVREQKTLMSSEDPDKTRK